MNESRIIVAMDGMTSDENMKLVSVLKEEVAGFKFNSALDRHAERIIGYTRQESSGSIIWSDIKVHDIPNTVKNRIQEHASMGTNWITVHASGSLEMIRSAVGVKPKVNILAVTVLTSLNEDDCNLIYGGPVKPTVLKFSMVAKEAGAWGIVCSGLELKFLKEKGITGIKKVVPGIRPAFHGQSDDQKRKMTPAEAIQAGASYLVVGRPITQADSPLEAAEKINDEVARALAEMVGGE